MMSSVSRGKVPFSKLGKIKWLWRSAGTLIYSNIKSPVLRAILLSQAGDYGLPPSKTSALVHIGIMRHYFNGGFYPKGGAYVIPRAFVRSLKRADGEIKLKTAVDKIIVGNGKAIGIKTANGDEFFADNVISNRLRLLTARIIIGHHNPVSELLNHTAHQWPLTGISVTAGTKHTPEIAITMRSASGQASLQRLVGVGKINDGMNLARAAGKTFHATGDGV